MSNIERLPEGWCLYRDDGKWAVGLYSDDFECGGYCFDWLASGDTIADAIAAGHARLEREKREAEERRADFERRKAAGQLTPLETASSYVPQIWSASVLKAVELGRSWRTGRATSPTMMTGGLSRR